MEELLITVDENSWESGIREILQKIRPTWSSEVKFKVSHKSMIKKNA